MSKPENFWTFQRVDADTCVIKDQSGSVYYRQHGDLAAHACQDFMRWTEAPDKPGGEPKEEFGLKPAPRGPNA